MVGAVASGVADEQVNGSGPARRPSRSALSRRALGLALGGGALVVLLAGCSADSIGKTFRGFGWPGPGITPQAHRMYNLWIGSVLAALAVGFLVWGLIFYAIIRYRKRGEALPPQVRYNLPIEVLYTIAPFLVIAVLFYHTAVTENYVDKISKSPPDVHVEVVAFRWNWQFNYEDVKAADGRTVSTVGTSDYVPVLVLPTDERILISERSNDVIHSFYVPDMLFKRDVFPGVTNQFEITIDRPGAYVGRCAELCGAYHAEMNFEVRAVPPEQYRQFIDLRKQGKTTPEALRAVIGGTGFAVTTRPFTDKPDTSPAG